MTNTGKKGRSKRGGHCSESKGFADNQKRWSGNPIWLSRDFRGPEDYISLSEVERAQDGKGSLIAVGG